jgi:hypothetical protein
MLRAHSASPSAVLPVGEKPRLRYRRWDCSLSSSVHRWIDPRHPPPGIRVHRQQVDDVRPVLPVLVAVAHQAVFSPIERSSAADSSAPHVAGREGDQTRTTGPRHLAKLARASRRK